MRCGSVVSGRERGGQGPSEEEVERSDERREGNALAWNHRGHIVRARVRISNTDRPAARPITETANTPVFEPRGHPRVDHQVIRNDSSSSSSSSSSSRFFSLSPPADKRIATGHRTGPPLPLSICIPHRYAKKECLRHPRHPRTEAISLSRNEAFSSTSAFLRNRTPSREGKGTPSRGEWPYQRFLVSRPGKRNWIDGRTGVGAICVEILESPNSREFQHLYPVKTGTEEKGGEGRGEKIGGRDAWIRTRTHRGTRTS